MKRSFVLLLSLAVAGCAEHVAPPEPALFLPIDVTASSGVTPGGFAYTAVDLGTLGGPHGQATHINESGQVAGYSYTASFHQHAFRWQAGIMTDLGTLGGTHSLPFQMNSSGQIVGHADLAGDAVRHAAIWNGSTITDLGVLPGYTHSDATAINDHGLVAGTSYTTSSRRAFSWQGGVMTELPSLGGSYSFPYAINNDGTIVGVSHNTAGWPRAVMWKNGVLTDLGTLGGPGAVAFDINDAGQVTGYSYLPGGSFSYHAFRWENGVMTDLGGIGNSVGRDINRHGDVAGHTEVGGGRATLWTGSTLTDLGTLPGGVFSHGFALNDSRQVTGTSSVNDGPQHVFLWESGTMIDLGTLGGSYSFNHSSRSINNQGQVVGFAEVAGVSGGHAVLWQPIPVTTVTVDIKPGSSTNAVNPRSNGLIAVAILSTSTFDAATVDPLSVRFGPGAAGEAHGTGHLDDVNGDGLLDLLLHFDTPASGISCGDTSAKLTGQTIGGQQVAGVDGITTSGCK